MAIIGINQVVKEVQITQTTGAESATLDELQELLSTKMICAVNMHNHPEDIGGPQSPRKVLVIRFY